MTTFLRRLRFALAAGVLGTALAQGSLSGTVHAPSVLGLAVIACFPSEAGCDEARSGYAVVEAAGSSAAWHIDGLGAGPFVLVVWQDADGDGEASEAELTVYGGSEPALVSAPASGIELRLGAAPATGGTLVGAWRQGSVSTIDYYNPATGAWAPPSGSGFHYDFRADGSYTYSGLMQSSLYSCTMSIFSYQEGRYASEGQVLALEPSLHKLKSEDNCNAQYNYEKDVPLEPEYLLVELGRDAYGAQTMTVTYLVLNAAGELEPDPEYADAGPSIFYRDE